MPSDAGRAMPVNINRVMPPIVGAGEGVAATFNTDDIVVESLGLPRDPVNPDHGLRGSTRSSCSTGSCSPKTYGCSTNKYNGC